MYAFAKTSLGDVKGLECKKPNIEGAKQVFRFSGIPFAKPPVGDLRFEAPQKFLKSLFTVHILFFVTKLNLNIYINFEFSSAI